MDTVANLLYLVTALVIIWALPVLFAVLTLAALPISREERRRRRWTAIWVTIALAGITGGLYPLFPAGIGLVMLLWTGYWLVRWPLAIVAGFRSKRHERLTIARMERDLNHG